MTPTAAMLFDGIACAVLLMGLFASWCACKEKELIKRNEMLTNPAYSIYRHRSAVQRTAKAAHPPLSKNEKKTLAILMRVKGDSIWVTTIRNICCKNINVRQFRMLIEQLSSQAKDNPAAMQKIIGKEGYDAIVSITAPKSLNDSSIHPCDDCYDPTTAAAPTDAEGEE